MRALTHRMSRLGATVLAIVAVIAGTLGATPAFALTPFDTVGTPTVSAPSGVYAIGQTLTASPGTWVPSSGVTFNYQWKVDGVDAGTDSSTYVVGSGDAGLPVTVVVTANKTGYEVTPSLASSPHTIDAALSFTALPRPSIIGVPQVGTTLSVSNGTWSPTPTTFTYRWLRDGDTEVGTSSTYTPVAADRTHFLVVEVTPVLVGYTPVAKTSLNSATVAYGSYTAKANPTITGATTVGSTLTANTDGWTPTPSYFTYQWTRNGTDIGSATNSTYVLQPADLGALIRVRTVSNLAGYADETRTSSATAAIASGTFVTTRPTISKTTSIAVTDTLTASVSAWTPTATFTYQWKRDGAPITTLGTSQSYIVTNDDRCAQISVTVTGTTSGYTTTSTTSDSTDVVSCGSFTNDGSRPVIDNVSHDYVVGTGLAVDYGFDSFSPTPTAVAYQWYRNGVAITSGTSATYTPTSDDLWKTLTVKVTATKPGYAKWEYTSAVGVSISEGTIGNTAIPVVSGVRKVARTLTASNGTWSATPGSFTYQWYRDGSPIENAVSQTYNTVLADLGAKVTVGVTAVKAGYTNETVYSDSVSEAAIAASAFDTETKPTISGTVAVGRVLTAAISPDWSPLPTSYTYQWTRNGTNIADATASTYTLVPADETALIRVVVTAHRDLYPLDSMTSDPTVAVVKGTLSPGSPTISGTAQYGRTLTAATGTWSPVPGFSYQWTRDGVNIGSATGATYVVQDADISHVIAVKVTGALSGYNPSTATSPATATVNGLSYTSPPLPTITGDTVAGSDLTAVPGTWLESGVSFSYQWRRDGISIDGATSSTYTTTSDDIDHALTVRVGGSLTGYATLYQTSSATSAITGKVLTKTPIPTLTGILKAGKRITAVPGDWGPGPNSITFTYQWLRGKTPIPDATSRTYVLGSDDYGKTITVAVTGSRDLYRSVTVKSKASAKIALGLVIPATDATISGDGIVGHELTVEEGSDWNPGDVRFAYAWYRGDKAIKNATDNTYTPVPADVGEKLTVQITGKATGYTSATAISAKRTINLGEFDTTPTPTISGTVTVGQTLTAATGDWSGNPSLSYHWIRTKSGVPTTIPGATSSTYVLTGEDLGARITVTVTGTQNGYAPVSMTSDSTSTVAVATFTTTSVPTVVGIAKVGQTLQANLGTWLPTGATFEYQWQAYISSTWTDITDATDPTYTIVAADLTHKLRVTLTATKLGYTSVTANSVETVAVANGQYNPAPLPVITGTVAVGQTLSVNTGGWTPQPASFTYVWKRGSTTVGTDSTYVPVTADVGSTLTVTVVPVALTGYDAIPAGKTSLATAAVVLGTFSAAPTPTISGSTALGGTVVGDPGAWTPAVTTFEYKWKRDGVAISPAATNAEYVITVDDLGSTLTLEVKAIRSGYNSVTKTATIAIPLGTLTSAAAPVISGTAVVGQTLTATTGSWSPAATVTYQWYRGVTAITGATSSTFVITTKEAGKSVKVVVTGHANHYADLSVNSNTVTPTS